MRKGKGKGELPAIETNISPHHITRRSPKSMLRITDQNPICAFVFSLEKRVHGGDGEEAVDYRIRTSFGWCAERLQGISTLLCSR